jgi:hypothetical protein
VVSLRRTEALSGIWAGTVRPMRAWSRAHARREPAQVSCLLKILMPALAADAQFVTPATILRYERTP